MSQGWLSGLCWMGLGIILGLAKRLAFNSKNYSFTVLWHSSFMTFRFSSSAPGAAACGWVQGKDHESRELASFFPFQKRSLLAGRPQAAVASPRRCPSSPGLSSLRVRHRRTSPASFITLLTVLLSEDNISKAKGQFLQPRLTWPAGLYFPLWLWVIRSGAGRCYGLWRRWFKVIVEMSAWLHELGSQKQQHVSYIPPLHGPDYRFLGSLPWENLGLFWSKSVVNTLLFESS